MADLSVTWSLVSALMHKQTGVLFTADQSYLLESRVQPVAQFHKYKSIADFVSEACSMPPSHRLNMALVDAMTTHESYFFRDAFFWQFLQNDILKKFKDSRKKSLRIWSAACSYGQEAYSLAMFLYESNPELLAVTQIYASDVSAAAIERGKAGLYSSVEVNRGLTAPRLIKHFDKAAGGFQVKSYLKQKISWSTENLLLTSHPGNQFDIVLCRNVLIYFDAKNRQIALKNLLESTVEHGYIGLGTSENLLKPQIAVGWHCVTKESGRTNGC